MAKPVAPLLAFSASGTVAKTAVYASWRGRQYVRRWVVPANPKSTDQELTRSAFKWLQAVWKVSSADFQAPWTAFASGRPLTNRNAFGSKNIAALRVASDLSAMVFSPGANAGLAPVSAAASAGSGQLTVTVTAPTTPTGWTAVEAVAVAIRSQDPNSGVLYTSTSGTDSSAPYSIVLTGLTSSQLYQVGAWMVWTKPDGTTAYGPSVLTTGTPS